MLASDWSRTLKIGFPSSAMQIMLQLGQDKVKKQVRVLDVSTPGLITAADLVAQLFLQDLHTYGSEG